MDSPGHGGQQPIKASYSTKASPTLGGSWGKKWIALYPDALLYYSSSSSKKPRGACVIECQTIAAMVRSRIDRRSFNSTNYVEKVNGRVHYKKINKPHVFGIETLKKPGSRYTRTWYFTVDSDEERNAWVKAINDAATARSQTEAGIQAYLQHCLDDPLGMVRNDEDAIMMIKSYNMRRDESSKSSTLENMTANPEVVMSKLVRKYTEANLTADLNQLQEIQQIQMQMVANEQAGIVDFALQRKYMSIVSKHPTLKVTIQAPPYVGQNMLPSRPGFWIASITPLSPASFVPEFEPNHQVIIAINGVRMPDDAGQALEILGTNRWTLAMKNIPVTYTVYNLKSRLFSTIDLSPNPNNLASPPEASGLFTKWVDSFPNTGVTPLNEEPAVQTVLL